MAPCFYKWMAKASAQVTHPTDCKFLTFSDFCYFDFTWALTCLFNKISFYSMKKKPQRKKYGLLSDYDENMELGSMESDEEKIFESRNIRR